MRTLREFEYHGFRCCARGGFAFDHQVADPVFAVAVAFLRSLQTVSRRETAVIPEEVRDELGSQIQRGSKPALHVRLAGEVGRQQVPVADPVEARPDMRECFRGAGVVGTPRVVGAGPSGRSTHLGEFPGLVFVVVHDPSQHHDLLVALAEDAEAVRIGEALSLAFVEQDECFVAVRITVVVPLVAGLPEVRVVLRSGIPQHAEVVGGLRVVLQRFRDVQVATEDGDGLSTQAHEPLDVVRADLVLLRAAGVLEDHDLFSVVGTQRLADDDAVATDGSLIRQFRGVRVQAVRATVPDRARRAFRGLRLGLFARVDIEAMPAFLALGKLLVAVECLAHASRGDDVGIHDEQLHHQHQHDDEYQRFRYFSEGISLSGRHHVELIL